MKLRRHWRIVALRKTDSGNCLKIEAANHTPKRAPRSTPSCGHSDFARPSSR